MRVKKRLATDGGIVIPAEFRRELNLEVGDEVILQLDRGELRMLTLGQVIERAQEAVRRYVPEGQSLVGELIAERAAEASCN